MTLINAEVRIAVPREHVWNIMADLEAVQDYSSGVTKAYYTSEAKEGVGASRHCDLNMNMYVEERVLDWQPGGGYTIEIYEASPPIKRAVVRFNLEPDGDATIVRMHYDYELMYGPIGVLMDWLMVRRQMKQNMPGLLTDLKAYIEQDEAEVAAPAMPATIDA